MHKKAIFATILLASLTALLIPITLAMPTQRNYVAHLSGKEWISRVNPTATYGPIMTKAQGEAIFQFNKDLDEIHYKLIVANIENVIMAHIHIDTGVAPNGPIVVWLYPRAPPDMLIPGRSSGILSEGTITSADLVNLLAGMTLNDLMDMMMNSRAYVVVHTSQYPIGEIRGWIQ
jgi:hypothetical protein